LAKHNIKAAAPVATPVQAAAQTTEAADEKASQEKVKELA